MILMAGWSEERGRPKCWAVASGNGAAGAQQIMNTCAPSSSDLMGCLGAMGLTGGMDSFDPLRDGLRIMRAQGNLRFPHPISYTVITAKGISTHIAERWPDSRTERPE
jgi:hypothetical protein